MTRQPKFFAIFVLPFAFAVGAFAQGTSFIYQGRLNSSGATANGSYDFRFRLASDALGNNYVGNPVLSNALPVSNGLFAAPLDFGAGIFTGSNYWLQVDVKTNGAGGYTTLTPLQALTPSPYAIFANTASNVSGTVAAAQVSGALANANLPANPNFSGAVTANSFSGNGVSVTNVNAVTLNGLAATNFWKTSGNSGTTAGTDFIGTTDNQALELKVNGSRALRVEPNTSGAPNVIGGAPINQVDAGVIGSTIAGGGAVFFLGNAYSNRISADFSFIGGGNQNSIQTGAGRSTIGGGWANTIQNGAFYSTIGGGYLNTIQSNAYQAAIGGGYQNSINYNSLQAVIAGGVQNKIEHDAGFSVIGGGAGNLTTAGWSTLGGGDHNTNYSTTGFIGGGKQNITSNDFAVVAGGLQNAATGTKSVVAGGEYNNASGTGSFIGGGSQNSATNFYSTVAGGFGNKGWGYYSTTAGGALNTNNSISGSIGGGTANSTVGSFATVPGGQNNAAAADYTFAAGRQAKANHTGTFVWADGGGVDFISTGINQFLIRAGGGVGIGLNNPSTTLDVNGSARIRGSLTADSALTLNAGLSLAGTNSVFLNDNNLYLRGDSNHGLGWYGGSKLFSGQNIDGPALFGFEGGVLGTTKTTTNIALRWYNTGVVQIPGTLQVSGNITGNLTSLNASNINSGTIADARLSTNVALLNGSPVFNTALTTSGGLKLNDSKLYLRGGGDLFHGIGWYSSGTFAAGNPDGPVIWGCGGGSLGSYCGSGGSTNKVALIWNSSGFVGISQTSPSTLLQVSNATCNGTTWANASDRNLKENFSQIDSRAILAKVAALPVLAWNYKDQPNENHVGPMAQDFYAAFNLGSDDKHITTVDEGGVALAAIQGLNQVVKEKDAKISSLEKRLTDLEKLVKSLAEKK